MMKKTILVLVLLAVIVCMIASCSHVQNGGTTNDIPKHETPSLAEMKEINHKIYVANRREELLKNHKSVAYSFKRESIYDLAHYYYIMKDFQYLEGDDWAEINKGRMTYKVYGRLNADYVSMLYEFNLLANPEADLYQYVSATEDGWQDYDHDTLVDCYTLDGKIHLFSQMDEVSSEVYATTILFEEYEGQTYRQETILDATSYELLFDYVFRKDGDKEELVATHTIEYDIDEPAACSIMRVAFEKQSENMMTVSFVADPDTEQEIAVTAEIPVNNECTFIMDDMENFAIYTDRDCTEPVTEHWNRMSDITYYIKHK